MKSYIKEEFKRAFISKNTIISIILTFICIAIGIFGDLLSIKGKDSIMLFLMARSQGGVSILSFLIPIIVCIPFVDSYVSEKESGFLKYIYLRVMPIKYVSIKIVVNALVGGVVASFGLVVTFIILVCTVGISDTNLDSNKIYGAFSSIYFNSPIAYIIILILVSFAFGVVFSTLGLGISTLINNKYLSIIAPFFYYIISGTVFELLGINKIVDLHAATLFNTQLRNTCTSIHLIIYDIVIFLVGIILFLYGTLGKGDKIV